MTWEWAGSSSLRCPGGDEIHTQGFHLPQDRWFCGDPGPRTHFVLGFVLLVTSYDMQENTVGLFSPPCTYKGPEPTGLFNQSSRTGTQFLITSRAPLVPFSRLLRHAGYSGPILTPDPRGSISHFKEYCSQKNLKKEIFTSSIQ